MKEGLTEDERNYIMEFVRDLDPGQKIQFLVVVALLSQLARG